MLTVTSDKSQERPGLAGDVAGPSLLTVASALCVGLWVSVASAASYINEKDYGDCSVITTVDDLFNTITGHRMICIDSATRTKIAFSFETSGPRPYYMQLNADREIHHTGMSSSYREVLLGLVGVDEITHLVERIVWDSGDDNGGESSSDLFFLKLLRAIAEGQQAFFRLQTDSDTVIYTSPPIPLRGGREAVRDFGKRIGIGR